MIISIEQSDLLWATYQTQPGKKFFDSLYAQALKDRLWNPNAHINEHAIYYFEGRRSILLDFMQMIEQEKGNDKVGELKS
jgi:hypothetical protein